MSWLSKLWNAVNPRQLDEDVAEEMRDHLQRRTAALKEAGLSGEEAERQARLWYGNTTQLREESRDFRLWAGLEGSLQDIRYAWRGMRKGPAFAVTAVLSLALAIGATTAVYSVVDAAILRPLPVFQPDQLFILSWPAVHDPGSPAGEERKSFSYPEYLRFRAATKSAARLGLFGFPNRVEAQGPGAQAPIEKVNRGYVSGGAFDLLGVSPAVGRLFSADEDRIPPPHAVAVLSYEYWQRRFHSDPGAVGQNLMVEGKRYEIAGVARKGFFGVAPGKFIDVWLPGASYEERALAAPEWHWLQIIGRFAPGISPAQVEAMLQPSFHEFQVNAVKQYPTMPAAIRDQFLRSAIHVRPAASGVSDFRRTFSRALWTVFAVAAGILLIACANVASILLARSAARATEMAMRVSLGAARMRLVRQMLTESLLLSFMAGGAGWLFAWTLAPLLVHSISTADDPVQLVLAIHTRVLFFCIGVSTLSAVLFGLAPAWQASGAKPMGLARTSIGRVSKLRLGKFCVSIQVACAFCLVMTGAAFVFSLSHLLRVNPGFDARNVAVVNITAEGAKSDDPVAFIANHPGEEARLRSLMFQLQNRMTSQLGIQGAALAPWPIFEGRWSLQQVIIPGKGPSEREEILYQVSPGYFATLRNPLIAGRDFAVKDSEPRGLIPAIVNQAFAQRYFNGLNVVGQQFSYDGRSVHHVVIVGVAADARYDDLRTSADPMVYLPTEGVNSFTLYVRSPLPLGQVVRILEREIKAIGPGIQVHQVTTLETLVGNTLTREKLLAGMGGACAFLGLLLAAIGLFGLFSYTAGRRTKEIGIRAALGARRTEIISLILKEASGLMTGGLAIGLAGALAAMTVFRSLLFAIGRADPFVIGTAIGIFLATGLTAAWLPAYRAARLDPMSALREE